MEDRFVPLNAIVAMHSHTKTSWPRPLFDVGYRMESLELPVNVSEDRRVTADVVAFKSKENRFLLHEAKSGANVEESQADRYKNPDMNWLTRATSVTLTEGIEPRCHTIYACLREHEERALIGLANVSAEFPVLSISNEDVHHVGGPFDDPELEEFFRSPVIVPGPPPGIIVVDADSGDEEIDRVVVPSMVSEMSNGSEMISVPALARLAIPYLDIYPTGYQNRLIRKVDQAARRPPNSTRSHGIVKIKLNPEELDLRGRTQSYQAMASRFQPRRSRIRVSEDQGQLFGDADLERELSQAKESDDEGGE
jgi:hypothetical protein